MPAGQAPQRRTRRVSHHSSKWCERHSKMDKILIDGNRLPSVNNFSLFVLTTEKLDKGSNVRNSNNYRLHFLT